MQKKPIRAITFYELQHHLKDAPSTPPPHENIFNRLITLLGRISGLTRQARRKIRHRMQQLQVAESVGKNSQLDNLYNLQNRIVNGGWPGLWTAIRVCLHLA